MGVDVKHRIGEFSKLTKVTVKTLRYYDGEGILKPALVDRWNGYRYYLTEQMNDLVRIREFREIGLSIDEIRRIQAGADPMAVLKARRGELEDRISRIDRMMEDVYMSGYNAEIKTLPGCTVAYRHGVIPTYADLTGFIFEFARLCRESNPDVRCLEEDYCFVTYTKPEYQERDVELTYAQAVERAGRETPEIGFKELEETAALCVKHRGSYSLLGDAYAFAMKEVAMKGYAVCGEPRECYIDGCWNKESEEDWLTEIQIPIRL